MGSTRAKALARLGLLCAAAIWLGGCSTIGLLYGQSDWLVTEYVDGLTDLNDQQEGLLYARLGPVLAWHRATELPIYGQLLRRADKVAAGTLDGRSALEFYDAARDRYRAMAEQLVGAITPTLVTLSPEQLVYLEEALADRGREFARDYAQADSAERAAKRRERVRERVEDWTGPLTETQVARLVELTDSLPDVNPLWLAHRRAEERRLLRLLREGSGEAAVRTHLAQWLVARHLPPRLDDLTATMRLRTADLMVAMAESLSDTQRLHLRDRIVDYARLAERLAADT